jgi:hypothetical protein
VRLHSLRHQLHLQLLLHSLRHRLHSLRLQLCQDRHLSL